MLYEIEPSSAAHQASVNPKENFLIAGWDDLYPVDDNGDSIFDNLEFLDPGMPERAVHLNDLRDLRHIYKSLFAIADLDDITDIQWEGEPLVLPDGEFPLEPLTGAKMSIPRTAVGYLEAEEYHSKLLGYDRWYMRFDIEAQVGRRKQREEVESMWFRFDKPGTRLPTADMYVDTGDQTLIVRPASPTWVNGINRAKDFFKYATEQFDQEEHNRHWAEIDGR